MVAGMDFSNKKKVKYVAKVPYFKGFYHYEKEMAKKENIIISVIFILVIIIAVTASVYAALNSKSSEQTFYNPETGLKCHVIVHEDKTADITCDKQ